MLREALVGDYRNLFEAIRARHYRTLGIAVSDINEHLPTLGMLTVEMDLRHILELGVRDGDSTIALLNAARAINGEVTSIDIEDCPIAQKRIQGEGLAPLWTFIHGGDLEIDWDRQISHLFIDTTHEYGHTVRELERYAPFVAPGGLITLHDFAVPGVRRAVVEFVRDNPEMTLYSYMNNNGLAVIFKEHL